ncbi:MAG: glycosyltransferase family 4 protein [Planctomycetes bacterium]|nr:glycosyltransferase family 4 protein [Planctomycetota bacterium]
MRIAFAVPDREAYGFGAYLRLLLAGLSEAGPAHEYVIFTIGDAADHLHSRPPNCRIVRLRPARPRFRWRNHVLAPACASERVDLVHFHNNTIWKRGPVPAVVSLQHYVFAYPPEEAAVSWFERWYVKRLCRRIARDAARVTTISEASARDIGRLLGLRAPKLRVIPLAGDPAFGPAPAAEVERVKAAHGLRKPYVLFPGSLGIRKNVPNMIRAFRSFNAAGDHEFVLAGDPPKAFSYRAEDLGALKGPDLRFLGFVPDADLPALYGGARALFYVTSYEGFGLPILDAFACGCPVVTTDRGATAEVAGGAALLADPDDVASMSGALRRLCSDPALPAELRARGSVRARDFSWRKTAEQTLELYREALSR